MSFDLPAILELGQLDEELIRLRKRLSQAPEQAAPQHERVAACKRDLQKLVDDAKAGVREVKRLEGEAEAKKQVINKNEVALNSAKSNEEYQTLLKAIEKAKAELEEIETGILEAYEKQDELEGQQKKGADLLKDREKDLAAAKKRVADLEGELGAQISDLEAKREAAAAKVDGEILNHYQKVLDKMGNSALVLVRDENCQGCFFKVRPNQISQIKGGKELVVCFHCGRMLYHEMHLA